MLKLTRVAALALIALAAVLAVAAFALSRRSAPAPAVAPVALAEAPRVAPAVEPASVPDPALLPQGYAVRLNPGERALAVPVDELVAAGNRILPGDYVDVFLNLRAPGGLDKEGLAQTRLLLSRLRVLSYGAADAAPGATTAAASDARTEASDSRASDIRGSSSTSGADNAQAPARSAVLAVPVAEANRLLLGAQQGKLFLALRNPTDVGLPDQDLFAPAATVLRPRGALNPEQRLALASPENDAFAGLDAEALAGRHARATDARTGTRAMQPARRAAPRRDGGVEIIRGEPSSHSGSR